MDFQMLGISIALLVSCTALCLLVYVLFEKVLKTPLRGTGISFALMMLTAGCTLLSIAGIGGGLFGAAGFAVGFGLGTVAIILGIMKWIDWDMDGKCGEKPITSPNEIDGN